MSFLAFAVSFVCFLIAALAGLFEWDLGDFDAVVWGLVFLSLGHVFEYKGTLGDYTRRVD